MHDRKRSLATHVLCAALVTLGVQLPSLAQPAPCGVIPVPIAPVTNPTTTAPTSASFPRNEAVNNRLPYTFETLLVENPIPPAYRMHAGVRLADDELRIYYHVPAGTVQGLVFVLHGGRGSARTWLTRDDEAALLSELIRKGYAVCTLSSTHRPTDTRWFLWLADMTPLNDPRLGVCREAWVEATINADEMLLRNVYDLFTDPAGLALVPPGTPLHLVGFSSGGNAASGLGYLLKRSPPASLDEQVQRVDTGGGLPVRSVTLYNAPGRAHYFGALALTGGGPTAAAVDASNNEIPYDVPILFHYGENDPTFPPADVEANITWLESIVGPRSTSAGGPLVAHRYQPPVVHPDTFARALSFTLAESAAIFDVLDSEGYIGPDHRLNTMARTIKNGSSLFTASSPLGSRGQNTLVKHLQVLHAEHAVATIGHRLTVQHIQAHP